MNTAQVIASTGIRSCLSRTRDALAIFERATGPDRGVRWRPVIAFKTFEALVLRLGGCLIGDEEMTAEGFLRRAADEDLVEADSHYRQALQRMGLSLGGGLGKNRDLQANYTIADPDGTVSVPEDVLTPRCASVELSDIFDPVHESDPGAALVRSRRPHRHLRHARASCRKI